jgi:TonB-linked SusC/RagA family outer membrane protein
LGYLNQEAIWGDATNYKRYNFRSNVDFRLSENTSFGLDLAGSYRDARYPGSGSAGHIIFGMFRLNPTNPIFYENGLPAGYFERNPYLDINESGYAKEDEYRYYVTAKFEQKVPFVPGLSFKGNFTIDRRDQAIKNWKLPYTFYQINSDDTFSGFTGNTQKPSLSERITLGRDINVQMIANYTQTWNKHNLDALLVFEPRVGKSRTFGGARTNYDLFIDELSVGSANPADITNFGGSSEAKQVGYAFRVSYNFDSKYMFETAGRYDGHYYFAPGKRFAFFPSFSAAWRVSNEPFFNSSVIQNLKVRASWGKSGNLAGGPNQWLRRFNIAGTSYIIGNQAVSSIFESIDPNTDITWEKSNKTDIGIELGMLDGLFDLEFDLFYEKRSDMLINSSVVVPNEYGIGIGQENNGVMENKGFDFSITSFKQFNDALNLTATFNFTYAKNKILEIAEVDATREDPERSRTGRPLDTRFGLKSLGYFQTQQEIDDTPYAVALGLQPGDIKYWDRNGDDQLNSDDNVVIGNSFNPTTIYGLDLTLAYKNLQLNTLWQGGAGSHININQGWGSQPFTQSNGVAFEHHLDYWTPDNPGATYPRITSNPEGYNYWYSSHWIKNSSYVRLKTVTLSYDFNLPDNFFISAFRVYTSGQNLLTFSGLNGDIDPESPDSTNYYWLQSVYSLGVNVTF